MSGTIRLNLSGISQNVGSGPQRNVSQAGAQGRELSNLGQQITRTGMQVGSLIERRRAEEARDQTNVAYSNEKVANAESMSRIQTSYENNPLDMVEVYKKETEKRQQMILKNITNDIAKDELRRKFNNENQLNFLKMQVYSRSKFTDNSIKNIGNSSRQLADSYYVSPVGEDEFLLDLDEHLLDIDNRDLDERTKTQLKEDAVKQMTSGIVTGYMKGGAIQDFARARRVLDMSGTKLSAKDSESLRRKIDSEQIRVQNLKAFNDRQNRIAIEKKFNSEKKLMSDIFDSVVQDPDYDASEELQKFKSRGHFNFNNFVVRSKTKMNDTEKETSENLMFSTMQKLADSERPEQIRNDIINQTLTGQMSAEDAQRLMTSIDVQSNSKFATRQFNHARNMIKNEFQKKFGIGGILDFNNNDKREINLMIMDMEELVDKRGLDPVFAAKVVLKTKGKNSLPSMKEVPVQSYGNQNTIEGIDKILPILKSKFKSKEISRDDFVNMVKSLNARKDALQDIPTFDEVMNKGNK